MQDVPNLKTINLPNMFMQYGLKIGFSRLILVMNRPSKSGININFSIYIA